MNDDFLFAISLALKEINLEETAFTGEVVDGLAEGEFTYFLQHTDPNQSQNERMMIALGLLHSMITFNETILGQSMNETDNNNRDSVIDDDEYDSTVDSDENSTNASTTESKKYEDEDEFELVEHNEAEETNVCVSCDLAADRTARCGHRYCLECIKQQCISSLSDRSCIPVRCCKQDFQQELVIEVLSPIQLTNYKVFQLALTSTSIQNLDDSMMSCVKEFGWIQCPRCGAGISKDSGCNHMTCMICKCNFCFLCSEVNGKHCQKHG